MRFDSLPFFLMFLAVLGLHLLLPWAFGRVLLLLASYVFYGGADPRFCLVLFASTSIDFAAAWWIDRSEGERMRKALLTLAVAANLSWLAVFKYSTLPNMLLPIGISFYTFKSLSYIIDVYRRRLPATHDFIEFALYVAYFPQLVAGPIERSTHLLPQLRRKHLPTWGDAGAGIDRILTGLFKKCVLADRLALVVDPVYLSPRHASAAELAAATLCFAFQLYWDFSGYTDIAIGMARLLGVQLSENFDRPFAARSPHDFWKRWHLTLTQWFREYLGGALTGGKRPSPARNAFNVVFIMTLVGLWHGAAWNFILFGLVSGLELALYNGLRHRPGQTGPLFGSSPPAIVLAFVGQFCLMLWMMTFFRARSASDVWAVSSGVLTKAWTLPGTFVPALVLCLLGLAAQLAAPRLWPQKMLAFRWVFLVVGLAWLSVSVDQAFIYYQF